MDQIKKFRSKFSKKASAGSKPLRDPKLRYSRSMPLRNSSETDTSHGHEHSRPVYRGERPLKVSDIQHVMDISPSSIANYENPRHGWPRFNSDEDDDDEFSDTSASYHSRRLLIDKEIIDKFPAPPATTPISRGSTPTATKPVRPLQRPPTINMEDFNYANDLLPEISPTLKAKMDATIRYRQEELRREAKATERRQQATKRHAISNASLGRSASSVSAYTRAPSAYPSTKAVLDRKNAIRSPSSTSLVSNTMSTPANALYPQCISNLSTQSLAPKARSREPHGLINPAIHSISQPHPLTPGRRRNPSIPSSSSPLSARRANAPSHADPYLSTPLQCQGTHNVDLYHPNVMRVLRGPHGATLQCPKPVKPVKVDVATLEVNDAEEGQEWGVGHGRGAGAKYYPGHKVKPMAATVAGYGRTEMRR